MYFAAKCHQLVYFLTLLLFCNVAKIPLCWVWDEEPISKLSAASSIVPTSQTWQDKKEKKKHKRQIKKLCDLSKSPHIPSSLDEIKTKILWDLDKYTRWQRYWHYFRMIATKVIAVNKYIYIFWRSVANSKILASNTNIIYPVQVSKRLQTFWKICSKWWEEIANHKEKSFFMRCP